MNKRVIVFGTASEQALVRTIEELERENAALREDKERLDCVEKNIVASFGPAQCSDNPHPIHQWIIELPLHGTLRAAIDAARKEAQP